MLSKNGTGMKENFGGVENYLFTQNMGGWGVEAGRGVRGASANQNKEGVRTNLRALRSLCGRLASGGSRRFRDT